LAENNAYGEEFLVLTVLLTNTSWWPTAARLSMALRDAGCEVMALFPARGHSLVKTRAVRRVFRYSSLNPLGSLRRAINACAPDVVIPRDDMALQHLHELHAHARNSSDASSSVILK
jgi:hypothetical protein